MSSFAEHIQSHYTERESNVSSRVHYMPVAENRARDKLLLDLRKTTAFKESLGEADHARVHVGAAGLFNFDILATGKHDAAVLIDINTNQKTFWDRMIKLLQDSPDADAMRENFEARGTEYFPQHLRSHNKPLGALKFRSVFADTSWHTDPESYAHIRQMALDGKIAPVTIDVFDENACTELASAIESSSINGKDAIIDTVYASNIWHMCGPLFAEVRLEMYLEDMVSVVIESEKYPEPGKTTEQLSRQALRNAVGSYARINDSVGDSLPESVKLATLDEFSDVLYGIVQNARFGHNGKHDALIAKITERTHAWLKTNYTDTEYDVLGITTPVQRKFHRENDEPAHLRGIQALGGNNHAGTIYLCATYGNENPLTKMSPTNGPNSSIER